MFSFLIFREDLTGSTVCYFGWPSILLGEQSASENCEMCVHNLSQMNPSFMTVPSIIGAAL